MSIPLNAAAKEIYNPNCDPRLSNIRPHLSSQYDRLEGQNGCNFVRSRTKIMKELAEAIPSKSNEASGKVTQTFLDKFAESILAGNMDVNGAAQKAKEYTLRSFRNIWNSICENKLATNERNTDFRITALA